ncbi:hypothetical protein TraAM80_02232 [Trypanosoma rangeli]|uniref:Uncharacterized protein n=1 Tax=Trypanosoma rangeli TaxID=5698 RepID=A0A3S5IRY9_TRYRA|nr:uncharacterized protein TraAM80_02232 [Trypanosoma rangeli]RNF09358.1 hypothetical protein TraAM80_02232 [Trypanosoma rangeli]|eukprot:RNF09358.1 hypothetical protein TraAM80_02232 [Trypanosoma rangeli]
MSQQPHRYHKLPWWKRIVLDTAYRQRVKTLATQRHREEMQLLQDFPREVASAAWDDGRPIPRSAQYICVEEESCAWATRHPESMIKVSAFRNLRTAAASVVVASNRTEERDAQIIAEVKRLYDAETASERLYGLSYVWNRPLPPNGLIRVWPDPTSAMWPALLAASAATVPCHLTLPAPEGNLALFLGMRPTCLTDPLCINVFRRNGEYLGAWRQSLFLIRFKVICWALHEEERQRTCGVVGRPVLASDKAMPALVCGRTLQNVPVLPLPLLRLQRGTVTFSEKMRRLNLHSLHPPLTWEGIAPAPSTYRAEQAYQNWHALHRGSAVVQQAVRDVFNLLPQNENRLLTKTTYVEFFLDLLNLFFPTHISSANIAIAEEEWVYRGTTDLVSFETFYEKFFSFPFIFLRDLNTVTRDQYVEVWCLIRICLLGDADAIPPNLCSIIALESSSTRTVGMTSLNTTTAKAHVAASHITAYSRPRRPMTVLDATLCSMDKLKYLGQREVPPLIGDIYGVTQEDVLRLGERNFHNTDNYALHEVRRAAIVRDDAHDMLSPVKVKAAVHARGQRLLSQIAKSLRRQQLQKEAQKRQSCGKERERSTEGEEGTGASYEVIKIDEHGEAEEGNYSALLECSTSSGQRPRQDKRRAEMGCVKGTGRFRAELEKIEEERVKKQLVETSVFYRHRRMRRHAERAKLLSHVSRSHSSWELYRQDVFELQHESLDEEEDHLLAFVRDLPDDFFDDENSLRTRYCVYAARLCALAERARHGNPDATGPSSLALLRTNLSGTLTGVEAELVSSYMLPSSPKSTVGGSVPPSRRGLESRRELLPKEAGWVSPASNLASVSVGKTLKLSSGEGKANFLAPSLVFSTVVSRNPADGVCGDRVINDVRSRRTALQRGEMVGPKRALQLRLQLKQELNRRYNAMLAARPRHLLPASVNAARKGAAAAGRGHVGAGARRLPSQQDA